MPASYERDWMPRHAEVRMPEAGRFGRDPAVGVPVAEVPHDMFPLENSSHMFESAPALDTSEQADSPRVALV